jgi:uncharacterized protein YneF (UPF0154 family)
MQSTQRKNQSASHWIKSNLILVLSIVVPFFVGSYIWGQSVEDDFRSHPIIDATEARWNIIEAYGGSAIVFGSLGALIYYIASAFTKRN